MYAGFALPPVSSSVYSSYLICAFLCADIALYDAASNADVNDNDDGSDSATKKRQTLRHQSDSYF